MTMQDTYLTALDRFGDVARDAEADSGLVDRADDYREQVTGFRVLIPLVGSFNAGKISHARVYSDAKVYGNARVFKNKEVLLSPEEQKWKGGLSPNAEMIMQIYGFGSRRWRH